MYYITTKADKIGIMEVSDEFCSVSAFGPEYLHVSYNGIEMYVPPTDYFKDRSKAHERAVDLCALEARQLRKRAETLEVWAHMGSHLFPMARIDTEEKP